MNWQTVIGLVFLAVMAYLWYTEKRAREKAQVEAEIVKTKAKLAGIDLKLGENKVDYDKALAELTEHPIPADMFDHVGKPDPTTQASTKATLVRDVRSGRIVDAVTGRPVPDDDPRRSGEAAGFNGA